MEIPDYKGHAITLNERGHFVATELEGDISISITKSTLSALRREIDKRSEAVPALLIDGWWGTPRLKEVEIIGVAANRNYKTKKGPDVSRWDVYVADPGVASELRAIVQSSDALRRKWDTLVGTLKKLQHTDLVKE